MRRSSLNLEISPVKKDKKILNLTKTSDHDLWWMHFFFPFTSKSKRALQTPLYICTVHKWTRVTSNKMQNLEINTWRKKIQGSLLTDVCKVDKFVKIVGTSVSECSYEICSMASTTLTPINFFGARICALKLALEKAGTAVWESTLKVSMEVFSHLGVTHSMLSRMYLSVLQPARSWQRFHRRTATNHADHDCL